MTEEPTTFTLDNEQFVYIDEEGIASLNDLIDFANANRAAFYEFRRTWGTHHMQTGTAQ